MALVKLQQRIVWKLFQYVRLIPIHLEIKSLSCH